MIAEELRGDARLSIVGIGYRERVPGFETSSLGIILLGRGRGGPRSYKGSYVSTK